MSALPPVAELPRWIRQHPRSHEIISAYNVCLGLQSRVQHQAGFHGKEKEKALIQCRILGYLFHHFPSHDIKFFLKEIVTISGQYEKLLEVGESYYAYFVKIFMSNKGPTPAPSSHPSRRSADDLVAKIKDELKDAPQNHQTAKKNALIRDGFRCVVTQMYDFKLVKESAALERAVKGGAPAGSTECAHIFPECINSNTSSGSKKEDYATTVLDHFGHRNLRKELNGALIHRLDNVMTMERTTHQLFDSLQIYFTATEVANTYKLDAIRDYCPPYTSSRYVTFSTPDPEKYPLPNPTYLAIHAACAKVAHLSGAAEHIEEVLSRFEDTSVLAEDGGSSEILYAAILSTTHAVSLQGIRTSTISRLSVKNRKFHRYLSVLMAFIPVLERILLTCTACVLAMGRVPHVKSQSL